MLFCSFSPLWQKMNGQQSGSVRRKELPQQRQKEFVSDARQCPCRIAFMNLISFGNPGKLHVQRRQRCVRCRFQRFVIERRFIKRGKVVKNRESCIASPHFMRFLSVLSTYSVCGYRITHGLAPQKNAYRNSQMLHCRDSWSLPLSSAFIITKKYISTIENLFAG